MTQPLKSAKAEVSTPLSSQPEPARTAHPRPETVAVFGHLTDAILATEHAGLSLLKVEMEGLSVLFGGSSVARTSQAIEDAEAKTEDGFDNMPV